MAFSHSGHMLASASKVCLAGEGWPGVGGERMCAGGVGSVAGLMAHPLCHMAAARLGLGCVVRCPTASPCGFSGGHCQRAAQAMLACPGCRGRRRYLRLQGTRPDPSQLQMPALASACVPPQQCCNAPAVVPPPRVAGLGRRTHAKASLNSVWPRAPLRLVHCSRAKPVCAPPSVGLLLSVAALPLRSCMSREVTPGQLASCQCLKKALGKDWCSPSAIITSRAPPRPNSPCHHCALGPPQSSKATPALPNSSAYFMRRPPHVQPQQLQHHSNTSTSGHLHLHSTHPSARLLPACALL